MAKKVQLKKVQAKKEAVKSVKKVVPSKKTSSAKKTVPPKETPKAVKGKGTKATVAAPKKDVKKQVVKKQETKKKEVEKKEVVSKTKKAVPPKKETKAKVVTKPVPVKAAAAKVKGGASVKEVKKKEVVPAEKKEPQKVSVLGKEMRALLLSRRHDLLNEILESRARESDSLKREIGDIYDEASSERERELSLLLGDRDRQKLKDIDEALQRIDEGEYGVCESCGEKIAPGRLKAQPFTKLCINCKAEEERQEARQKKFEAEGVYRNMAYVEEEEG